MASNKTKLRILCHNANGIYNDSLALQELLHSLDVDIALISETRLPTWFEWRNPGYRTYNTRGPNLIHGGTAVLVKANIQHAVLKSLC
jgi:Endonuclease/Exonuclease/phosphatase family.